MSDVTGLSHRLVPMRGRDPHQRGRVSSPLELLFDLTFVVAFGVAGAQFAHLLADGEIGLALTGYVVALFATIWAWINFTWFASAFDTDDWAYRLVTMLIMCGVVIFGLGIPQFFASLHHAHVDNVVMVLGYVVMRIGMAIHWGRAYAQSPACRPGARIYLITILLAQLGWTALALAHTSLRLFLMVAVVLGVIELAGPAVGERLTTQVEGQGSHTPWHPHHIAERYGLLVIITLGEGVVGTVAALASVVEEAGGWDLTAVLIVIAGVGLTFGIWWTYFSVDWPTLLHANPRRSFGWGYGHIPLFMSIAAVGAGLHVAGYYLGHAEHLTESAAVWAVVVPILVFGVLLAVLYAQLTRVFDLLHLGLVGAMVLICALALVLAHQGVSIGWCLILAMVATVIPVVSFETIGHRHLADALGRQGER